MPILEKVSKADLYLYEIIRNPALFGEFIANFDRTERDEVWEYSNYQREIVCDFETNVSICCGRSVGKTVSLSDLIIWNLINRIFPVDYLIYSVPNKAHLEPVFTNLTRMFRANTLLQQFIDPKKGINASDHTIKLLNHTSLLCRIAGTTGTGVNVVGLHSPFEIVDEAGLYPWGTWVELQPTLNTWERGHKRIVSGVPTGLREKNVLFYADQQDDSYTKHRVPAHKNPRYTEVDEQENVVKYGGIDSEDYIHLVLGQHGTPVFAVFDRNLMEIESYPVWKVKVDGITTVDVGQIYMKLGSLPTITDSYDYTVVGIDLGYCYSEDTDVLTRRGWLKHKDITTNDLVACYDTAKDELIWDYPKYIWKQDYKGKMLEVSGKSTNFCVSPKHSVWVNKLFAGKFKGYERLEAKDLLSNKNIFKVKLTAKSKKQTGPETFNIPYYYCERKDRELKNTVVQMTDWIEFLGWFTSEGSATANKDWLVNITQQEGEYSELIDKNLNKLPYTINRKEFITQWGKKQIQWSITCKELCLWLREHCGIHSENKKIPDFIFECSTEDQELFLRTLLFGDGSRINSNRSPQYNTQSEILVDQIQKLAISLGYSSTKGYYNAGNMYRCTIMNRQENELCRDNNITEIDYNGKIYCLKTTTGFYITRRKGRVAIQGNTEPTAIHILYAKHGLLRYHARVELIKVPYPLQKKLFDFLDDKFGMFDIIGVDSGGPGKPVVQDWLESDDYIHKDYKKRMVPIDFASWIILGINADGEDIKTKMKPFAVSLTQEYTNSHKIVYTSTDYDLIAELERTTYTKTPSGEVIYRTLTPRGGERGDDHNTSALLTAMVAHYIKKDASMTKPKSKRLYTPIWLIRNQISDLGGIQ